MATATPNRVTVVNSLLPQAVSLSSYRTQLTELEEAVTVCLAQDCTPVPTTELLPARRVLGDIM